MQANVCFGFLRSLEHTKISICSIFCCLYFLIQSILEHPMIKQSNLTIIRSKFNDQSSCGHWMSYSHCSFRYIHHWCPSYCPKYHFQIHCIQQSERDRLYPYEQREGTIQRDLIVCAGFATIEIFDLTSKRKKLPEFPSSLLGQCFLAHVLKVILFPYQ